MLGQGCPGVPGSTDGRAVMSSPAWPQQEVFDCQGRICALLWSCLCVTKALLVKLINQAAEVWVPRDLSWGMVGDGPSLALERTGRPGHASLSHNNTTKLAAAAHAIFSPFTVTWIAQQPHKSTIPSWSGRMVWRQEPHLNRRGLVWFDNHALDTPVLLLHVSAFRNSLASFSQTAHLVHCCLEKDKMLWYCFYIGTTVVD